jgi:hypothetical protein
MTIDVAPENLKVTLKGSDLTSIRFSACNLTYPNQPLTQPLGEAESGQLGQLQLNIQFNVEDYISLSPDQITIANQLNLTEVQTPVVEFKPCNLDYDGDGIVSIEDVKTIFDREIIPINFDINGDGVVNDLDRVLAYEYVGTVCGATDDPPEPEEFEGVFDELDSSMAFGFSLNRLLVGSYSNKPLFRLGMVVNNFFSTAEELEDPDFAVDPSVYVYMDRNQEGVYAQSPVVINYHTSYNLDGDPEGEVIYQDIFWKGSNEQLREDMISFYEYGKQLQEANGIPPEWDYYNSYRTRFTYSTARVLILYDQSGSGNNALMHQRSNSAGQQDFPANHCFFDFAPIVVSKGEVTVNENNNIAFSHDGSHAGDIEGLGRDESAVLASTLNFLEAKQPLYAPYTTPFGSACVYTVKSIISPNYGKPGLGESYETLDILENMAQENGFNSLSDIFIGDGTMDPNFNPYIGNDGSSSGADRRDIYSAFGDTFIGLFGNSQINAMRMYSQTNGQFISWYHPYVVLTGVDQNVIIEYEDYVGGYAPLKDQMHPGVKSFYLRMANAVNFGNFNQASGHKKIREGAVCAMTIATLPEIDFRVNNDQIVSGLGIHVPHGRYQPSELPYGTVRESFSEMAGFDIQSSEDYSIIADEVNEYYQTTPFETASNPPL